MCDMIEVGKINGRAKGEIKRAIKVVQNLLKSKMPLENALEFAEIDEKTYNDYKDSFSFENNR